MLICQWREERVKDRGRLEQKEERERERERDGGTILLSRHAASGVRFGAYRSISFFCIVNGLFKKRGHLSKYVTHVDRGC